MQISSICICNMAKFAITKYFPPTCVEVAMILLMIPNTLIRLSWIFKILWLHRIIKIHMYECTNPSNLPQTQLPTIDSNVAFQLASNLKPAWLGCTSQVLRVTGTHKSPHHYKVATTRVGFLKVFMLLFFVFLLFFIRRSNVILNPFCMVLFSLHSISVICQA